MRLQLIIQRQELPAAHILWTIGELEPPYNATGKNTTISQLLEQVNEIIPLESEDWGLEDYVVEVQGFECLHFSELRQILREDEVVCIRPLQTGDIRFRKISGRYQISTDGKHLIDGVAFGRHFLRRADRPAIKIPPRKRRRLGYDEEADVSAGRQINDRQVVVRADGIHTDEASSDDEIDDEDFVLNDEVEEDLDAELNDLQNDLSSGAEGLLGAISNDDIVAPTRITRSKRPTAGLGLLPLQGKDGSLFPEEYSNPLLDIYQEDEPSWAQSIQKSKRRPRRLLGKRRVVNGDGRGLSANRQVANRRSSTGSNKSVRFEDDDLATPATIREVEQFDEAADGIIKPTELDESDKENTEPRSRQSSIIDNKSDNLESDSSESSDISFSDSDETSSSGSSSSETSSSSGSKQLSKEVPGYQSDTTDSSSSGSSSSKSSSSGATDSEPERDETADKTKWTKRNITLKNAKEIDSPSREPSSKSVAPGQGMRKTKSRNDRRRDHKKMSLLKGQGLLPPDTTLGEFRDIIKANGGKLQPEANPQVIGQTPIQSKEDEPGSNAALVEKRQRLLSSIAAGGVDVSISSEKRESPQAIFSPMDETSLKSSLMKDSVHGDKVAPETSASPDMAVSTNYSVSHTPEQPKSDGGMLEKDDSAASVLTPDFEQRRTRLDLSSAKRMLFGSLGLRTPKTKQDEAKIREKLIQDAKIVKEPRSKEIVNSSTDVAVPTADDSWKEKVNLRAVECCYDGIELSTPPFPFVQRWDPQQRYGYKVGNAKKRKTKKRKRNDNNYYQESFYPSPQIEAEQLNYYHASKDEKEPPAKSHDGDVQNIGTSHDESFQDCLTVDQQLQRETENVSTGTLAGNEDSIKDLPTLLEDLTSYSPLNKGVAPDTVIAFKQLEMSADTGWQPKISQYKTAIVNHVLADGTLQMTLARRDRPAREVQYDERTGDRIYAKFDMPGYNETDEEANAGKLEILFEELINPLIVSDISSEKNRTETQNHETTSNRDRGEIIASKDLTTANEEDWIGKEPERVVNGRSVADEMVHDDTAEPIDEDQPKLGINDASEQGQDAQMITPTEDARQEISELIRDAGFRSSIHSGINGDMLGNHPRTYSEKIADEQDTTIHETSSSDIPSFDESPTITRIETLSSPTRADLHNEFSQASDAEIAESIPRSTTMLDTLPESLDIRTAIEYPELPQDDSDIFQSGQIQSEVGIEDSSLSQDLITDSINHSSPSQTTRSRTCHSPLNNSSPKATLLQDGLESDEEFPPLFSQAFQARMSQEVDIKSESSENMVLSPPPKRKSRARSRVTASYGGSNRVGLGGDGMNFENENEENDRSTPQASQAPVSSQIVDLMISSDTVDPPDSPYVESDSYKMPKGPGWVRKTKSSKPRSIMPAKANTGRRKMSHQ